MEPNEFQGTIGPTWREATPWWPESERAAPDAPNVVLFVLDDVGFAQLGCYGSDLRTPNIDTVGLDDGRLHAPAPVEA